MLEVVRSGVVVRERVREPVRGRPCLLQVGPCMQQLVHVRRCLARADVLAYAGGSAGSALPVLLSVSQSEDVRAYAFPAMTWRWRRVIRVCAYADINVVEVGMVWTGASSVAGGLHSCRRAAGMCRRSTMRGSSRGRESRVSRCQLSSLQLHLILTCYQMPQHSLPSFRCPRVPESSAKVSVRSDKFETTMTGANRSRCSYSQYISSASNNNNI